MRPRTVTVYCGSSPRYPAAHAEAVREFVAAAAADGVRLVYGGGDTGLMGVLRRAARERGADLLGIVPRRLLGRECGVVDGPIEVTADLDERKRRLRAHADVVVAFPGSMGTLDEFFDAWSSMVLGTDVTPLGLIDCNGYWDGLLRQIRTMAECGYLTAGELTSLIVAKDYDDLVARAGTWRPPVVRWTRPVDTRDPEQEST